VEKYVVIFWIGIRRLTDFFATASSVKKLLLICLQRELGLNCFALNSAKPSTLNNSFVEVLPYLLDMYKPGNN